MDKASSGEVDLLHSHSLWMMPTIYPGLAARRHGIPLVVSPRGTLSRRAMSNGSYVKRVFWPAIQRPAMQQASCFHATAVAEYEDIRRMGFLQPVSVLPNGIDIPPLLRSARSESRTLLFLGRIHPIKGVDLLLEAWRTVSPQFRNWHLRIVGPDNFGYLREMKRLAAEFGLARVEFAGPLFGKEKLRAYQDADLFVLPTHSENFGVTVAEALAAGIPAIVTRGAPWGGLNANGAGWWIDGGVDSLVAALELALAKSSDDLIRMGELGREWMRRDFSWDSIARNMVLTYQWILGEVPRPSFVTVN